MAAIPSENGDFVRWRLVSIEVNQYERYDGFADTQALKVFPMSIARAASQRHTVSGHHKITTILDATIACFHTDMDELIDAHPPRELSHVVLSYVLLFKAHSGAKKAARLWQEYFRNHHKANDWNDDDNASTEVHSDCSRVELGIEVFQNV